MVYVQIFGLFIAIWFTFINLVKAIRGQAVSGINVAIMSTGWVVFFVRWLL